MSWLDRNQNKILIGIWSAIFLTCLLVIFTDPVKASEPDIELPLSIGIPSVLSSQTGLNKSIVDNCVNEYLYILGNQYSFDGSSDFTCFVADRQGTTLTIVVTFDMNCGYIPIEAPTRSLPGGWSSIYYTNQSQHYVLFTYDGSTNTLSSGTFSGGWVSTWSFNRSELSIGKGWVLASVNEFPEYWVFSNEIVDIRGHASEPVDDHGHYIEDGNGNRIPKPNKPTPTVYTPPTIQFPTIDISSLEKLLESLIYLVQYFISYIGGVINGWFSNLLSNLDSWFDYVVQSFNYAVNNIVGAIKDLAQTFYNNMVSLFEPLYEFFSGVASFFNSLIDLGIEDGSFSFSKFLTSLIVPDSEDLADALIDADIHGTVPFILSVKTAFTNIFNNLSNLTPTKVFILPTFTWHNQTYNLSIDFSWYDNYKVYGDTIISGFLILFYLHWVYLNISSTLRGGSAIGHDLSKGGQ